MLCFVHVTGRTILLSTHHMDEADILGDRIAIISNGELKCCGSSLFLKNTFGEGYHLYLVKKETEEDLQSVDVLELLDNGDHSNTFISKCQESKVTEFINKYVSTAFLKSETARELHYILPFEEGKKGNFEKLFDALDNSIAQLHISSYGVMDTTLEEVFLKVTENSIAEEEVSTSVIEECLKLTVKEQSKELDNFDSTNTVTQDGSLLDNLSFSGTDPSLGEDLTVPLLHQASSNNQAQGHSVELGTFPANTSPSELNPSPTLSQHSSQSHMTKYDIQHGFCQTRNLRDLFLHSRYSRQPSLFP
ncbi:hypothetical protein KUTeg_022501 [Tegillarca granosa]|uniref:Uncharacterized protein n=1 Tax=Tegillarca granosa TaxID=220873 RepID=A0ABQ9E6Q8_TEGGR|nr:hypothetical protein KUTeg_022501 [Tegillarca granosa]